ncbi:ML2 [Symbiodinium pilosum]|uniref:ML2 protein n=2 Tax=Symbiodinium pilosum TaxID=2952 RepID=A0A812YJI6_SYMPI|nr:ML2 [Symbiodinium pilosum]
MSRWATVAAAATLVAGVAFLTPPSARAPVTATAEHVGVHGGAQSNAGSSSGSWGATVGVVLGAHLGLAAAWRTRATAARAEKTEGKKYVETIADQRLFEQVYLQYTSEYLKGPLYWHPNKLQGWLPDYPGTPMIKEGKYTSHVIGNLKAFSSNELAFLSMLFFGVGLYGNLQFDYYDPQWAKVDAGGFFNVSYIVESFLLPISFFMHIACYIQRQNGK